MASHIRKDQVVEVVRGDHKGARGKVLRLDWRRGLVVVEGVNMVYRHVRPYDSKAGRGRRVKFETERDAGGKVVSKKRVSIDGNVLETLRKVVAE
jgi:ribosomal protein L24